MADDIFELDPDSEICERKDAEGGDFVTVDEEVGIRDEDGNLLTSVPVSRVSGASLIPDVDRRRIKGKEQPSIRYSDRHPETDDVDVQLTEHPTGKVRIDAGTRHQQIGGLQNKFHGHAETVSVSGATAQFRVGPQDMVYESDHLDEPLGEPSCEYICQNCKERNFRWENIDNINRICDNCGAEF